MQTVYYTTTNFIRHTDNVVDLNEYRRKLAQAQEREAEDEVFEYDFPAWETADREDAYADEPCILRARPRRSRRERRAWILDTCASLGVLVMTLTFSLHVLL